MPGKALTVAVVLAAHVPVSSGQDVLPIEALRAPAETRVGAVFSLRVSYEVYQDSDPAQTSVHLPHIVQAVLIDAETGRYSLDRTMVVSTMDTGQQSEVTTHFNFDGVAQGAYLPERGIGLLKEGADLNPLVESGLWGLMMWSPPQPEGLGIDDGSLVSLLKRGRVRGELESVAGRLCHVVDVFDDDVRYATVWLDVERDLLPMRRVTYGHDGQPTGNVTVESVVYLEDQDLWLPESWQTVLHLRGRRLTKRTVIHPESVEINPPVHDDDFAPRIPPGTIVTDQIAGRTYRVGPDGEPGEVLYEQTDDGQWHRVGPALPAGPRTQDVGRPNASGDDSQPDPRTPLGSIDELLALAGRAVRGRHPAPPGPTTRPAGGTNPARRVDAARQVAVRERTAEPLGSDRPWRMVVKPPDETPAQTGRLDALLRSPYLWIGLAVIILATVLGRVRNLHS